MNENGVESPITGRVWFVTGASRGLGREIAKATLAAGDSVVATARRVEDLAELTDASGNADRSRVLAVTLDVTDESQVTAAVEKAVDAFGRIDVVVNNAGYGLLGAVEETTAAQVRALFATNVEGVLHVLRATLPILRAQNSGHILNVSSLGGFASSPGNGVYGATKFAVEGISEALAAEVAPFGIRVTVIEPGFFRTNFLSPQSIVNTSHIDDYDKVLNRKAADFDGRQPGDPRKAASVILQLVSSENPPVRMPLGTDAVANVSGESLSRLSHGRRAFAPYGAKGSSSSTMVSSSPSYSQAGITPMVPSPARKMTMETMRVAARLKAKA